MDTRKRMAAESILENEALRDGLQDEQAASVLLNWGVAWAEHLAAQTAHIADDLEAEEKIDLRMRALRKILVTVKDMAIGEDWPLDRLKREAQTVFSQAQVLNGESWHPPEAVTDETWLALQQGDSLARIASLRALISAHSLEQAEDRPVDAPAPTPTRYVSKKQDEQSPENDGDHFARFFKPKRKEEKDDGKLPG